MTDPTNPSGSKDHPNDLESSGIDPTPAAPAAGPSSPPTPSPASSTPEAASSAPANTAPASTAPESTAPASTAAATPVLTARQAPGHTPEPGSTHTPETGNDLGPPAPIETSSGDIFAIADGETRSLDPKYIPLQRVSRSIGSTILSGAGFIVVLTISLVNGFSWVRAAISFGVWGLLTTLLAIWVFHWPTVRYRHMSYQVDRKGFRFREGVYWQSSVSIPTTRIQHTDVSQGPIERHFGLSTLIVHTAGTEHASVSLDGLRHETSLKIRDFLLAESKAAAADSGLASAPTPASATASAPAPAQEAGTAEEPVASDDNDQDREPSARIPGEDHGN